MEMQFIGPTLYNVHSNFQLQVRFAPNHQRLNKSFSSGPH